MVSKLFNYIRLMLSEPPIGMITGFGILSSNLMYRYFTLSEDTLTLKNKYVYTSILGWDMVCSTQNFNFVSETGNIYNIPNSILALQFDAEDKWARLNEKSTYKIRYWGIRQPFLSLFPRVYDISLIK
jgi:hypothetical protein